MKRSIALIIAVLFIFSVASIAVAADAKKPAPAPAEKKAAPKRHTVTGEVTAVDAAAKTITVKSPKKGDVVISVDDKTLAEVKAGDKVKATYITADEKNTAKSVKKVDAKKKAETKKAEPAKAPAPAKKPAGGY